MAGTNISTRRVRRYGPFHCKQCGIEYYAKAADRDKYCSRECAFKDIKAWRRVEAEPYKAAQCVVYWPACDVCGIVFLANNKAQRLCSIACKKEDASRDNRRRYQSTSNRDREPRSCKCCGHVFAPEYGDKRRVFCSDVCAARDGKRIARKAKKRAGRYGVAYEFVNPIKVFERDGWKCQICGKATPRSKRGKLVSNAPELDHRIPISKGGAHTYSNTQCACRKCNSMKGNTRETGQLPMFQHAA